MPDQRNLRKKFFYLNLTLVRQKKLTKTVIQRFQGGFAGRETGGIS